MWTWMREIRKARTREWKVGSVWQEPGFVRRVAAALTTFMMDLLFFCDTPRM